MNMSGREKGGKGKMRRGIALAALLLAACAGAPRVAELPGRDAVRDFAVNARFALRQESPAGQQSGSGRLDWLHRNTDDHVLVADPFGRTLAELRVNPARATLRLPDGTIHQGNDAAELLAATLDLSLPVGDLSAWLLGRGSGAATIERDTTGRPLRLQQGEWTIAYAYEDENPDALPSRLTLRRGRDIELRLRIEEWRQP